MKKLLFLALILSSFGVFSQDKNGNTPVAITETSTKYFSIYPNPVEDRLSIITTLEDYTIEIINSLGQVVALQKNNSGLQTLDYSNHLSGLYILKLTAGDISETFKIVRL
ncbi:MAG: T9SS type A sorting domain-containing protein [Flavobacteriaceae bacterium]|nr:T9SS type A sorting domain-containing protein [Flavobacteriaceae bacterium]